MPELPEIKIMSDFINQNSENRTFSKIYHVEKGNIPIDSKIIENFEIKSNSFGKELQLNFSNNSHSVDVSVFMGMSGNWKFIPSNEWDQTKFVRMRIDSIDGHSLVLHGGYMGPKYKIGKFGGVERGPDPTKEFNKFKDNILINLNKKDFDVPICDALLNQKYFNGIGNYIRSTILYYLGEDPFDVARNVISNRPDILDLCRDVPQKSYQLNGGQLRDWINPFDVESGDFKEWVYYQKGLSCKDKSGRTFWYDPKWKSKCPY